MNFKEAYMNLEEYINALQLLLTEHPELKKAPVYYASDDEGNAYRQVWSNGTIIYTTPAELNNYELENQYIDFQDFKSDCNLDSKDAEQFFDKNYIPVVIIN